MLLHCGLCRLLLPNLVLMPPLDFKRGLLVLYGVCQFLKPIGTFKSSIYILSWQYCSCESWFLRHFLELFHIWWSIGVDNWLTGKLYFSFMTDWLHHFRVFGFRWVYGVGLLPFYASFHLSSPLLCSRGILCGPFSYFISSFLNFFYFFKIKMILRLLQFSNLMS